MHRLLLALLLVATLCAPARAETLQGECNVSFTGTSTLHDFSGTGTCSGFDVVIADDGTVAPLEIVVPVASMDTDNDSRDKKMREMFDAEHFPNVVGRFAGGQLAEMRAALANAAAGQGTVPLTLVIRDVEVPVQATVTQLIDNDRTFSFDLSYALSLATCRLEAPSVLGLIRVGDEVKVHNQLHLRPLPQN